MKETIIAVAKFLALTILGTIALLFAIGAIYKLASAKIACSIFFAIIALILVTIFYITIFDEE